MWSSIYRSLLIAVAGLHAGGALAASSGHWTISEAPDGVKAGVVFPDFSPNDFVGLSLRCKPGAPTIAFSVDSAAHMPSGSQARVTLFADDARADYCGRAENSEMDDQTRIVVETASSDPIFAALGRAARIAYAVGGARESLPTQDSRATLAQFMAKCGARAASGAPTSKPAANDAPASAGDDQIVDEPKWGFALRVPDGWKYERSNDGGIQTWKLRNRQWIAGQVPDDLLQVTVTVIDRTPGRDPEQEFRDYAKSFAEKLLNGGRVTHFAPTRMGALSGFAARATGSIARQNGSQLAVGAVVILLEAANSHVIASAVAPSAAESALDRIGAANGMFGPSRTTSEEPAATAPVSPVQTAPKSQSDTPTPVAPTPAPEQPSAGQSPAANPSAETPSTTAGKTGLVPLLVGVIVIAIAILAFSGIRRARRRASASVPPRAAAPPVRARFCTQCGAPLTEPGPCPGCGAVEEG